LKFVKYLNILLVLCVALATNVAFAETTTSTELKIGLVDKQVLGQDSLYAKNVHERMKKEFSTRQDALVAKEKALMTKYEDLERNKDVISESERVKKERELAKMQQDLKEDSEAFQADVMQRQEKEGASFEKMVTEVLSEIAKEEKLDLILQQQVALFNGRKSDYTYKALQLLDKRFKEAKK